MRYLLMVFFSVLILGTPVYAQQTKNNMETVKNEIFLIDKFIVPKEAVEEFRQRMNDNRNFIKNLPGFVRDEVFESENEDRSLAIVTIACWANKSFLDEAKSAVQAEFKKTGFNPQEFYQRLNIRIDRGIYRRQ